ncbi:hypothetical protein E4U21_002553 [Claviceps maximensis]|nr:hypothetical protein E4U21_002553 [Claviceps maximensis]
MSAPAPQLLLRKASGTSNATDQPSDQANVRQRTRRSEVNTKSGKGKGVVEKQTSFKNTNEVDAPQTKASRSKSLNEGEKVVIRRLPPGLTQQELITILGPDWEISKGKVDWFSYVPGKVSADPSKPSRPTRAYLHLMRKDDIMPLSEVVRNATWEDAKATFTNPALVGPPVLEFSLYKKIGATKKRTDARQGTIDQDPEFMAFLESLANPAPMRESIDVDDPNDIIKTETKITTTPLVEYLKEKKANKGKDGGAGKNSKSGGRGKGGSKDDDTSSRKKGKESKGDRTDKNPKDTVKILTKKTATDQAAEAAKKTASQITSANPANAATTNTTTTAKATVLTGSSAGATTASGDVAKSRRAGIAAAARILQRDLGLSPGSAHRRARHDAAKVAGDGKVTDISTKENDTKAKTIIAAVETALAEKPYNASETPSTQTSKGKQEALAVAKSQSGRRGRGGRNADKGKGPITTDALKPTATSSASTALPTTVKNPPVILKKKTGAEVAPKTAETQLSNKAPSMNGVGHSNGNGIDNGNGNSISNSNGNGSGNGNAHKQGSSKEKGNTKQAQKKTSSVSTNATCAFVKPVTASQGVNDASLREVFGAFGTITLVDIDKRKSFAYVEFSEHDALVKAVAASPLSIGQASVQVLERKDKKAGANATSAAPTKEVSAANGAKEKPSGGRGRRGRGGGGKAAAGSTNGHGGGNAPAAASKEAATSKGG